MILFLGFVALLSARTFAAECHGLADDVCDYDKGLYCEKMWTYCDIGVCKCMSGTAWDTDKCKIVVAKDEDCSDTATKVCDIPFICSCGRCVCPKGTTYDADYSGRCLADAMKMVGKTCSLGTECESGFCDTTTCKCPVGLLTRNNFCYKPAYGEDCDNAIDMCEGSRTDNLECDSTTTKCTCTTGKIPWTMTSMGCKANGAATSGDACTDDDSCSGDTMQCTACGTGTTDTSKKCREAGTAVLHNAECDGATKGICHDILGLYCYKKWTSCVIGVCACKTGTVWTTDECKTVVAKDGDCTDTATKVCETPYTCTSNKCVCPPGTTYDADYSGKCFDNTKAKAGAICSVDDDCESATCTNTKCTCLAGYLNIKNFCFKPAYGEDCDNATDVCEGSRTDNLECDSTTTKCVCTLGKIPWATTSMGCKVDGTVAEGAVCTDDDSCDGDSMQCTACGTGSTDTGKKCRKVKVTATDKTSGTNNVTGSFAVLMIGIALFSIYF